MSYVAAGYGVTIAALAAYAFFVLRKGRRV